MAKCLDISQSCRCSVGSLAPVRHCAVDQICFGVVVCQQFGLGLGNFGKPACQDFRNAFMQLALAHVQHRLKGRVADQRMLEGVVRLRRCAALFSWAERHSWMLFGWRRSIRPGNSDDITSSGQSNPASARTSSGSIAIFTFAEFGSMVMCAFLPERF